MTSKTLTEWVESKRPSPNEFSTNGLATLVALAAREPVVAYQETGAAAVIARHIVTKPMRVGKVSAKVKTCGTAGGPTTVMPKVVRKNAADGTAVDVLAAAMSIAHDDADGISVDGGAKHATSAQCDLAEGDMLIIEVTAAATNMAGLAVTVELEPMISV